MRTLPEALDEVNRELAVRRRLFPRWILDGKISRTDALDRLERLETASFHLSKLCDLRDESLALRPGPAELPAAPQPAPSAPEGNVVGLSLQP